MFNKIYNFLLDEKLLNPNQSEFPLSNSCVNQLLAITHEVFQVFACNPSLEVRSVFVDISKAFGMVFKWSNVVSDDSFSGCSPMINFRSTPFTGLHQ